MRNDDCIYNKMWCVEYSSAHHIFKAQRIDDSILTPSYPFCASDGDQTLGLGQVPGQHVPLHCRGLRWHRPDRLGHENWLPPHPENQLQQAACSLHVSGPTSLMQLVCKVCMSLAASSNAKMLLCKVRTSVVVGSSASMLVCKVYIIYVHIYNKKIKSGARLRKWLLPEWY